MFDISKKLVSHYVKFFDIPPALAERMLPYVDFKVVERNEILVLPGEICTTGYLVVSGGLILSHVNQKTGTEKVVNFFLPTFQPFFNVTDSYFTGAKTQCKLFAFKKTTIGYLDRSVLENKLKTDKDIMNYYLLKLNEILVLENNLRVQLITSSPEQFYHYLITTHPQIFQKIPTKYIAQFMGISREWLSKIKSNKV